MSEFTDNKGYHEETVDWKLDAIADGWSHKPIYEDESESRAADLEKEGFHATVYTRKMEGEDRYEIDVSIWGPDGLAITPPRKYDWGKIKAGLRTCNNCGKTDVDTVRYSFAGRCCKDCLPEMRRLHERPGWTS